MYRVMAADDEPMMRKALKALIDWKGLGCELAAVFADGQALLEAVEADCPDIVICDIKMPRRDGIAVAKAIRERGLPAYVILLTAYADFSYAQQAIQYGVRDYVTKTGAVDGIVEAIRKCQNEKERAKPPSPGDRERDLVTFYRLVFDGSLYESGQLEEYAARLSLDLRAYTLLAADLALGGEDAYAARLTGNFCKLLSNAMEGRPCTLVPLGRCRLCAVLRGARPPGLLEKCQELGEAFRGLTGERVYLGVSAQGGGANGLRPALEQALWALEGAFYRPQQAAFAWEPHPPGPGLDAALYLSRIGEAVAVGGEKAALGALNALLAAQRAAAVAPQQARSCGTLLLALCQKRLLEAGADGPPPEAAARIQACRTFEEYRARLEELVRAGCRGVRAQLSGGSGLIPETLGYIEGNYRRPIALGEIAAAVGVNPSYLSRVFKEKTGMSLVETINRKKIGAAQELLAAGRLKIHEVAAEIGVEDTAYFSHLFRRYTGLSPKAFQERAAKERAGFPAQ